MLTASSHAIIPCSHSGYATGDPAGRVTGAKVGAVGALGLLLSATWTTIAFITETNGKI